MTKTYVVKPGDWMAKIAEEHGTTWQAIWNHPLNAEHRRERGSPDLLQPGDVLQIPVAGPSLPTPPQQVPPAPPQVPPAPPVPPPVGPWPYPPPPPTLISSVPTWECPEALCVCDRRDTPIARVAHTIFLHDDRSRRMPGARCRVHLNGRLLDTPPNADGCGAVALVLPPHAKTVVVEWAPGNAPLGPTFPYRRRYALHDDDGIEAGVRRRLQHIGVSQSVSLRDQIRDFQRAYGLPVDGRNESVAGPLFAFHYTATLPPLAEETLDGVPALFSPTPDLRPPAQGCLSAVSDRDAECHFSFILIDEGGARLAGQAFRVGVGGGRHYEGVTDGAGKLEYGDVPGGDHLLEIGDRRMSIPALGTDEPTCVLLVRDDSPTDRGPP